MKIDNNFARTIVGSYSKEGAYVFLCDTMINVWGSNYNLAIKWYWMDSKPFRYRVRKRGEPDGHEIETDPVFLALWRNWKPYSAPDPLLDRMLELYPFLEPTLAQIFAETA